MAILNKSTLNHKITRDGTNEKIDLTTDSNTSRVNLLGSDITVVKSFDKNWVVAEEIINVTVVVTNNSDVDLNRFSFEDTLSIDASFVDGSLSIGGQSFPDYNIENGFSHDITLGGSGADFEIKYQLKVATHTLENAVENTTKVSFYAGENQYSLSSNKETANILDNQIYALKNADKKIVMSGDTITYTIAISNEGTVTNTDLFFSDPIPTGTTFVTGSVTVDSTSQPTYDPATGFALPDLSPNQTITVTFQVEVE